ncbi:MAG: CRISPR-associated endonuclease Cas1 [Deltaproteobacteria bacterium]|nr:CRISPR-associated endonuclease Cas1 [Deltaproteobacteria bacterium]
MLNEYAYCPRLFALEYVHREWADSADTVDGRTVHRRVDRGSREPLPDDPDEPVVVRSVDLSDPELGLVARIDLVEADGDEVVPVDYKRGKAPDVPEGAWEPVRVQLCAQGLLLRAHGYRTDHGVLYFAGSRRRVPIRFDDALIARTRSLAAQARALAQSNGLPPPLVDSPKCPRCSLVSLCLPDEHGWLTGALARVRPLTPQTEEGLPLYVHLSGGSIGKSAEEIVVRDRDGGVERARIADTSRVVVLGSPTVTTPLLQELARRDIPVSWHTSGGWYLGTFAPAHGRNVPMRIAQHRAAADPERALVLSRAFVHAKIANSRVLLRRNGNVGDLTLDRLATYAEDALGARQPDVLLGIEGNAARTYFEAFGSLLTGPLAESFGFDGRNRRPPKDPVNALLSFGYAMLVRELTVICAAIGLDPYVGFLHQPRYGRPALACDLMEEFRPVIADSAVLTAVNTGAVTAESFIVSKVGCSLTDAGRRAFIRTFEKRLGDVATHSTFGTRLSYRRILEVQARLLGRVLLGELVRYPEYRIR